MGKEHYSQSRSIWNRGRRRVNKYRITEDVRLAKRVNNNKRGYLLVNKNLGKHLAVKKPLQISKESLPKINKGKTLVIAFAETATALGVVIADLLHADIITTTREEIRGEVYDFKEEHSHATEQKLAKVDFTKYENIVFVDDEITTGKTIDNIEKQLNLPESIRVYRFALFDNRSKEKSTYAKRLSDTNLEDVFDLTENALKKGIDVSDLHQFQSIPIPDIRTHIVNTEVYKERVEESIEYIRDKIGHADLVMGTEEFMYPAIMLANRYGCFTQSTTRSPIGCASDSEYPIHSGLKITSFYEEGRPTYIYNLKEAREIKDVVILTDSKKIPDKVQKEWVLIKRALQWKTLTIVSIPTDFSTIKDEDAILMFSNLTGKIEPLSNAEREKAIAEGISYGEMLPEEKEPTQAYIQSYKEALAENKYKMESALTTLARQICQSKKDYVLVSIARAGLPAGILLKRKLEAINHDKKYKHYSISIIRGGGIDNNAINHIVKMNSEKSLLFIDGWTGKGAIANELNKAMQKGYPNIDYDLAVISDPAQTARFCGTTEDFLIPHSCLNATISGMLSRTINNPTILDFADLHGCFVFDFDNDFTYDYIESFEYTPQNDLENIAHDFNVTDMNLIKPGIGETTRVLLRRNPQVVLVRSMDVLEQLPSIKNLISEKGIPVKEYPLSKYICAGIIQGKSDL